MASAAKSVEITIGVGEDQRLYLLEFSIDAFVRLEERLNLDVEQIGAQLGKNKRLGFARALLWAAMQTHQEGMSEKACGELLLEPGGDGIGPKIIEAFSKAFPDPEPADGKPRPQEAAAA